MRKLGQLLLAEGVISPAQLDEALQSQVAFGGRLGSNLVELNFLTLDQLAAELSKQLQVPVAPPEWLEKIPTRALRSLSLDVVRRVRALPLKIEPRIIHVVMLDPREPQHLEDLEKATSRKIEPYLLPELRLHYWLERHYRIPRSPRYVFAAAEATPVRAQSAPAAIEAAQELTDEATFESTYAAGFGGAPPGAVMPPAPLMPPPAAMPRAAPIVLGVAEPAPEARSRPAELIALERALHDAVDRDEIIAKGSELALAYVRCIALFVVHRGEIQAIRISGDAKGHVPLERIRLPLSVDCIITATASSGNAFYGKVPVNNIDEKILRALGRRATKEAVVLPVKIRNRVVNVLYLDNGTDELPASAKAAIASVAESMSAAYERVILERKQMSLT